MTKWSLSRQLILQQSQDDTVLHHLDKTRPNKSLFLHNFQKSKKKDIVYVTISGEIKKKTL